MDTPERVILCQSFFKALQAEKKLVAVVEAVKENHLLSLHFGLQPDLVPYK